MVWDSLCLDQDSIFFFHSGSLTCSRLTQETFQAWERPLDDDTVQSLTAFLNFFLDGPLTWGSPNPCQFKAELQTSYELVFIHQSKACLMSLSLTFGAFAIDNSCFQCQIQAQVAILLEWYLRNWWQENIPCDIGKWFSPAPSPFFVSVSLRDSESLNLSVASFSCLLCEDNNPAKKPSEIPEWKRQLGVPNGRVVVTRAGETGCPEWVRV